MMEATATDDRGHGLGVKPGCKTALDVGAIQSHRGAAMNPAAVPPVLTPSRPAIPYRAFYALVALCLLIVAGAAVVYVKTTLADRAAQREIDWRVKAAGSAADLQDAKIADAILHRYVTIGMTSWDVQRAIGRPDSREFGPNLDKVYRSRGGVEVWYYDGGAAVIYGVAGTVIWASDEARKPRT